MTQPGNYKISPKEPPKPKSQQLRNSKRVLIRLRKDSTFFDKGLQIQLAIRDKLHLQLADLPNIKETNTGFALTPRTVEIQQKILQNQQQWGPLVGLEIAEKDIQWHTYFTHDFPRTIPSWDGTELNYKQAVEDAIKHKTGLHPVRWRATHSDTSTTTLVIHFDQPVNSRFHLLGLGSPSIQSDRPPRLTLCDTCRLFHTPTACQKPKVCGNCGSRSHDLEGCRADTRCVGCYDPHDTGSPECFALPKRTTNGYRALSKTERNYAIQQGKAAYERWEYSQQKSAEKTQAPTTDQDVPDTEMTEAGGSTSAVTKPQHPASIPEDDNLGNSEESDLSEGYTDTDVEAEADDEEGREEIESEVVHWRTDRPNTRSGTRLAEWAEQQGLLLLNEPDTDTTRSRSRTRPSTIDLAFSNIDGACAVVEECLTTGSLHYTVCIEALAAEVSHRVTSRYKVSPGEDMETFVAQVKTAVSSLQPLIDSHKNIEQIMSSLSNIIEKAIRTCGHRQSNHKAGKNPWWNEECADALLDYRVL